MEVNKRPTHAYLVLLIAVSIFGCSNPALIEGEGYAEVSGGKIWYYVLGESENTPLVFLHGGPGGSSNSMFVLGELSRSRPLLIFDQIGTGKSGMMTDTSLMNIDYFVGQLHEFLQELGLKKFYLYGHSWGTALALDYYLTYPSGVEAMILNSPLLSTRMWIEDADTLIAMLPDTIEKAIREAELKANFDDPAYRKAEHVHYKNFIRRGDRIPNPYDIAPSANNDLMYEYMWGPSEFTATGSLRLYDRIERLEEIRIPTLYLTGEYDEARPATVRYFSSLTPLSEFAVIEGAGHGTMHDNQEQNIQRIDDFLERLER